LQVFHAKFTSMTQKIKYRFAPSPTGRIHIGNVRTAIITWIAARSMGGDFMLRIDDTDAERSKDEYTTMLKEDLTWLGLNWDDYAHQRDRMGRYEETIQKLKDDGRLYPCYETSEQLELKRKSLLNRGLPPIYDRAALELTDEELASFKAEGRNPHWRFKMNHGPIIWNDLVRGSVNFDGALMSDPVLIREDGRPLYHICSVIDDIDFGITHVTRGEDHVSNTASHVQMFEALGATPPIFAHLPLLSGLEGEKLSKRIGSLAIGDMRDEGGFEPMAITSLLARLGTSDPIEALNDMQPLVDSFSFDKFSRGTPKVDPQEVERLNAKIVHGLSYDDVKDRPELNDVTADFWNNIRANLVKVKDVSDWVNVTNDTIDPKVSDEDKDYIATALELLPDGDITTDTWGAWTAHLKEKTERKGRTLFMPLRQALTGMDHGPEMDKMIVLLGRERVMRRLERTS
jgi:glutamyl-tRNA synthetase